jgi:hypothetical protein
VHQLALTDRAAEFPLPLARGPYLGDPLPMQVCAIVTGAGVRLTNAGEWVIAACVRL